MRPIFASKHAFLKTMTPLTCNLPLCSFSQKLHAIVIDLLLLLCYTVTVILIEAHSILLFYGLTVYYIKHEKKNL